MKEYLNLAVLATNFTGVLGKAIQASVEKADIKAQASIKEAAINANKEKCVTGLATAGKIIVIKIIASTTLKVMEEKK